MKKSTKKIFWKVFSVASFLFITIFFILPYLIQISTYFHENGHLSALEKYGVEGRYTVNLLETIPNFFNPNSNKLGVTRFNLNEYLLLSAVQKADINLGGIISDLRFMFLIGIYLAFVNVYAFYKVYVRRDYDLTLVLATNWVLFMWLLALTQISVANLTYNTGDFMKLVDVLARR